MYISLINAPGATVALAESSQADPDALYARREDLDSARRAADIWAERLRINPSDFEAAWKLARACYWLGGHVPAAERRSQLERGMAAARAAIKIHPNRPESHFWLAANMGTMAESQGLRAGLKYRKPVRDELETALKIDPSFQDGSPDRALGRWYFRVPGLFGGSNTKSEFHLRRSLTYQPNSIASHYYLAETLLDMGRKAEARAVLEKVLELPVDPGWEPEDKEFKTQAARLLEKLGKKD